MTVPDPSQPLSPPRLARLLISLVVPVSEREFFIGDLDEEFQERARTQGVSLARRWYWHQTLHAPGWWHRTSPDFGPAYRLSSKGELMLSLVQDVRYAVRSLSKSRSVMLVAVIALALGIGANTAVFSVINAVLIEPLPYAEPERLVRLWDSHPNAPAFSVAPGNLSDWTKQNTVFAGLGAYREDGFSLSGEGISERVTGARVTAELLRVLGVSPAIGRWFSAEEDRPGAERVVILGHDLWTRRFGADRSILGRTIRIEREPHSVVGVMPEGFRVPIEGAELWIPYALDSNADRSSHLLRVIGRLNDQASIEEARTEMARIAESLERQYPQTNKDWRVRILLLDQSINGDIGRTLSIMLGAVGLILLMASANVANLLLARTVSRRKEIAIRLSIGASRGRLLRQFLVENVVLSVFGGVLGLGLAALGLNVLKSQAPGTIPRLADVSIDSGVLLFTAIVSVATGLLVGLAPAFRGSRLDLSDSLKVASHGSTTGRRDQRSGRLLVIAQVALAMVVVVSSGLMLRTLWNLYAIDPGFRTEGRLTFGINLNATKYAELQPRAVFMRELLERLRSVPGVVNAAATHRLPMTGNSGFGRISFEGQPEPQAGQNVTVIYRSVTQDYFSAIGIPLLRGRTFNRLEVEEAGGAVVVNQRMAQRFWPGDDPVGKRLRPFPDSPWLNVIGVVADSREGTLDREGLIGMYVPYATIPLPAMTIVVHTSTAANSVARAIREEVRQLDPDVAVADLRPLDDVVSSSIAQRSFTAGLLATFAAVALVLAASGIYGLLAYAVTQRVREIGVRMALGATRTMILRQVVGDGLRLVLLGVTAGTVSALAATRLLSSLLFGVTVGDPLTFAAIATILTIVGMLACYLPARRAASVDPVTALRSE